MKPYLTGKVKALAAFGFIAVMIASVLSANPAHAATTFTVDSTRDEEDAVPRDGVCDADVRPIVKQCTLRAAIEEANATDGADTINFNIDGSGPHTISPSSQLPTITDTVTINGYSQPGAKPNTQEVGTNAVLKIELDGTNAGFTTYGLVIDAPKTVVKGLVINRFAFAGIWISRGGTSSAIQGNFIGTDPSGSTDKDASGNDLGNSSGIGIDTADTTIGGTAPEARNLVSGNVNGGGIRISDLPATGNKVQGNLIGTTKDATSPLGNGGGGVRIFGSDNMVGGDTSGAANTISFNRGDGVSVVAETGNRIARNSIFSNGFLGIDLVGGTEDADGRSANDPDDADTGPNNLQNFPVITSATTSSTATTIRGTLNSTPNTTFTVQFFRNPAGTDEGKKFIGQKRNVTTDASGNATFTFRPDRRVSAGLAITATATDPDGNTSEFSDPKTVT